MRLPIIFIHKGYSEYMEYSLHQAKYSNPDSEIVLLGDASNNRFGFATHVNLEECFTSADKFGEVYKHYSTNPYHYELFCIQRWFVLKDYMEKNGIDACFVCDTDVMIFSDIDKALTLFKEADVALLEHKETCFLLGISFLHLNSLQNFCNYILNCYLDDDNLKYFEKYYSATVRENTVGGISDMTLAANWARDNPGQNVVNMAEVRNDATFDRHIGTLVQCPDDPYRQHFGRKKICMREQIPYSYSYKYKKYIRFHLLHFQGPAKYLMAKFYTGKPFPGKLRLDIKFFFANIAAFWYKTLRIRYRFAWVFNFIFKLKKRDRQKAVEA